MPGSVVCRRQGRHGLDTAEPGDRFGKPTVSNSVIGSVRLSEDLLQRRAVVPEGRHWWMERTVEARLVYAG